MNQTHFPGNESEKNTTTNNGKSKARWKIFSLAILVFLFASVNVQATTIRSVIQDNYTGGVVTPSHPTWNDQDEIGYVFDIEQMIVEIDSTTLSVEIYSEYLDKIGELDTELGDLFISTNGWDPYGNEQDRYNTDTHSNGTNWNYVLVMDDHSGSSTSGYTGLFKIDDENDILLSNYYYGNGGENYNSSYVYRADQEVRYDRVYSNDEWENSMGYEDKGGWQINYDENYLKFTIAHTAFGEDFNFRAEKEINCTFPCQFGYRV